jgi:tRNA (cytidine32/uridine32-2'-O)-methyltransferase
MSIRIVLVGTTHPGNIGAVARAMKNMGVADLALVGPRHFPHKDATARASGAVDVLKNAVVVETLDEAVSDCVYTVGASARSRAINWPTLEPRECAAKLIDESRAGPVAAVFGPEKYGLTNEHLDLCDALLTIPTNPDFASLNLGMAVQVLTYELRAAGVDRDQPEYEPDAPLATNEEMQHFYRHLEEVLTDIRFLNPENPRHLMRRLRRLFVRARPDHNEVNILRGILTAVERKGKPRDE